MRRARTVSGVVLATVLIAISAAACLPPPPPPGAELKLAPAALDYGTHPLSDLMGNMPVITVTVTNTGTQTVHLDSETSSNGIFSLPANTCSGASLGPGQSCSIGVQFCPWATGTATSTLTVTGSAGTVPTSVSANVSGTAT